MGDTGINSFLTQVKFLEDRMDVTKVELTEDRRTLVRHSQYDRRSRARNVTKKRQTHYSVRIFSFKQLHSRYSYD
jgi:hypothetical protein